MKQFWKMLAGVQLCLALSAGLSSCAVTDDVVSRHTSNCPAQPRRLCNRGEVHWNYFWGTSKKRDWAAKCPAGSDMTKVRVITKPHFIIISFLSLGIVVPQQVEWDCAPPNTSPGETP